MATNRPPVVEIDTEATAAYVRFGRGKVAVTKPFGGADSLVMVDFDSKDRVLGIEIVGTREFNIAALLRKVPRVKMSKALLQQTRYIAADLVSA